MVTNESYRLELRNGGAPVTFHVDDSTDIIEIIGFDDQERLLLGSMTRFCDIPGDYGWRAVLKNGVRVKVIEAARLDESGEFLEEGSITFSCEKGPSPWFLVKRFFRKYFR